MQQEWNYVYEVYKTGSFSKAAEKLFITQPALSIAIQKTEALIGMPLFDRGTRPLTLTQAGNVYIKTIEKMHDLEQDLTEQIQDIAALNTGEITIGGTHYINSYILPEILNDFHQKFPSLKINLMEGSAFQMAESLKNRSIDLTFSCDPEILLNFEGYPIFSDQILLAVPAADPWNLEQKEFALSPSDILRKHHLDDSCPALPLSALSGLKYCILRKGNNLYDRSMNIFERAGITPHIDIELSQLVTAYHLAESGYSSTFISDHLVKTECTRLKFYKLDSMDCSRRFYVLVNPKRYISHAVKAFIGFMQDSLKNTGK